MIVSDYVISDHNPGDDVLRFDMRLTVIVSDHYYDYPKRNDNNCFCQKGHACEDWITTTTATTKTSSLRKVEDLDSDCAIVYTSSTTALSSSSSSSFRNRLWTLVLQPFTKWDAARFLQLAVQPSIRNPTIRRKNINSTTETYMVSEQAHAFFPMFPIVIRCIALFLYRIVFPTFFLPPTFEALVVLAGILFNNVICVIVSTLAMYELTMLYQSMILSSSQSTKTTTTIIPKTSMQQQPQPAPPIILSSSSSYPHLQLPIFVNVSQTVCCLFSIWNPAMIFFATNYSESLFAMMTMVGHVCMVRANNYYYHPYQHRYQNHYQYPYSYWFFFFVWWIFGIFCWMIGSYTRSNGIIHSFWLLQDGLAKIIQQQRDYAGTNTTTNTTKSQDKKERKGRRKTNIHVLGSVIGIALFSIIGAMLVALPIHLHDDQGYHRHCIVDDTTIPTTHLRPSWCSSSLQPRDSNNKNTTIIPLWWLLPLSSSSSFSLYRYVQRKYWNVGWFHYWQWKQIPNFLLAAPILILSITAVGTWIYWSVMEQRQQQCYYEDKKSIILPKSKKYSSISWFLLFHWPYTALKNSVSNDYETSANFAKENGNTPYYKMIQDQDSVSEEDLLSRQRLWWWLKLLWLKNPKLLGHYAVLAILTMIGLVVAHVQISTRMICSSSPAIYWYLAYTILLSQAPTTATSSSSLFCSKTNKNKENESQQQQQPMWMSTTAPLLLSSSLIANYIFLYMLLGILLHVNFLPWT